MDKDKENNNKISFSAFWEIFRNSRRLSKMIWKEKKGMIIAIVFVFLILSFSPFLQSGSQGLLINELIKMEKNGGINYYLALLILAAAIFMFIPEIFRKLQEYLSQLFFLFMGEKFEILAIKKKGEIDIAVHENPKFNDLLNRISEKGMYGAQNFIERQFYLTQNLIEFVIASVIILSFKWWIFIIIFAGTIPEFAAGIIYGQNVWGIYDAKAEVRRKYWNLRKHFDYIPSVIELKTFQNTKHFLSIIKELYHSFLEEQIKNERKRIINEFIAVFISQAAMIFAMIFFIVQVAAGNMLVGTLVFVIGSMGHLKNALSSLFINLGRQYQDSLFVSDFLEFLDIKPVIKKPETGIALNKNKTPEIIFDNITFSYPGTEKIILKNFSLKISPGEKLALIGVNGAGKTTLIKLLCRFYDPTKGKILIDGRDLKEIDLESWYHNLGVLFQDYDHYHFVVKDAIAVGRSGNGTNMQKIKSSAKASEADIFIEEWENSYDQMLGRQFNEGTEPSIGQWQKLALARTFYRDPRILILDEPTSSIDAEAEAKIFEKLENLPHDRTVILISHRFSTVRHADKIAVIKDGELKELGRHKELLEKNGIYAKLFNLQAKGYK